MDRKTKGIKGEELAKRRYIAKGAKILESNYRYGRSEVDFIAQLDEFMLFVEVKARTRKDYGEPETFVSEDQKERIREAAEEYILLSDWKGDIRFDIVSVDKNDQLEVFEDAF